MSDNGEVYLSLTEDNFKKTLKEAKAIAISEFGEEDGGNELLYQNLDFEVEELEITDDDNIRITGNMRTTINGKEYQLGYLNLTVPITSKDVADFLTFTVKKINKMKTVLEGLS